MEDGRMKRLSDYKGEEAIELWADLLDPFVAIVGDKKIAGIIRAKKPPLEISREVLKRYKKEAEQILLTIDDTPLDGFNIIVRLIDIFNEILTNETMKRFFESQAEAKKRRKSSSSATASTEESPSTSSDM